MILQQKIGPFTNNEVIFDLENVTYLQLGVERPHSVPLSEIELDENDDGAFNNSSWPIKIGIKKHKDETISSMYHRYFIFSEKDILEMRMNSESISVIVEEIDNPYLIINAAYEIAS